jgi:hypothetical protein
MSLVKKTNHRNMVPIQADTVAVRRKKDNFGRTYAEPGVTTTCYPHPDGFKGPT